RTPAVLTRPAPLPGAGFPPRAPEHPGGDGASRPALAGLRVIDLGCGVAIPETGTLLAELGAEVIKVESRANVDFLRRVTVEPDAFDRSWTFNDASRAQLSVALDLRTPRGRELALRLCAAADVLIENNRGDGVRPAHRPAGQRGPVRLPARRLPERGRGPLGGHRGGRRRGVGALRGRARLAPRPRARVARGQARRARRPRPPRRRVDARAQRRGGGRGAPGGGRLGHAGPERRRSPRRPAPRRARRDRDRRAPRDRSRAAQREPDPLLPHAARTAPARAAPR